MTASCCYKPVGPPKGAVARLVMVMDIHGIHGLWKPQFGLRMLFFGPHGIHDFPDGPIYAKKTSILESNRSLSSVFFDFFGCLTIFCAFFEFESILT